MKSFLILTDTKKKGYLTVRAIRYPFFFFFTCNNNYSDCCCVSVGCCSYSDPVKSIKKYWSNTNASAKTIIIINGTMGFFFLPLLLFLKVLLLIFGDINPPFIYTILSAPIFFSNKAFPNSQTRLQFQAAI